METGGSTKQATEPTAEIAGRLYWMLLAILQAVMFVELVLLVRASQWVTALQVLIIMGLTLAPVALRARLPVRVPAEFQILAILFVFASLFLGEIRNYYELIWWWDAGLHASRAIRLATGSDRRGRGRPRPGRPRGDHGRTRRQ